jgi:uncharacterized membrane protein
MGPLYLASARGPTQNTFGKVGRPRVHALSIIKDRPEPAPPPSKIAWPHSSLCLACDTIARIHTVEVPVNSHSHTMVCRICGHTRPAEDARSAEFIAGPVSELIRGEIPEWGPGQVICASCLRTYRTRYLASAIAQQQGELSSVEEAVLASLREQEVLARNINRDFDETLTLGQRLADRVAAFGGSWRFILLFGGVLVIWIALNSMVLLLRPFDPYPFILLNLVLSCIAALQAPVIMMSQNRQEAKDRLRAEHDYQINLKAEIEIRQLHLKMDQLIHHSWQRLLEIQQVQIDLLEELAGRPR